MILCKKFIWRFVRAYLLVLLPLLSISVIVVQMNIRKLEEEKNYTLQQGIRGIELQMSEWAWGHHEKSFYLFQDKTMAPHRVLENSVNARDAILLLDKLKMFDEGVKDIFLYYGDRRIYAATGKSKSEIFFKKSLQCNEKTANIALEQLNSEEESISLLKTVRGEQYILYHYPMNVRDDIVYSVNYLLPLDYWEQYFSAIFAEDDLIITLQIGEEKIYYHSKLGVLKQLTKEAADENLKNREVKISGTTAGDSIHMTLNYNPKTAYQDVQRTNFFNMALLSFGIFLSMLLSFMQGERDRRRIQELTQMGYQKNVFQSKNKKRLADGFDYVQEMLTQMIQESCRIEQSAIEYREIMLTQISRLLFHGLIKDMQTVFRVVEECDVELYEEYYCFYGIHFENEEALMKFRKNYVPGLKDMVKLDKGYFLVFLAELPSQDPLCWMRNERMEQIRKQLEELGLNSSIIVSSQTYSELSLANCAYMEVVGLAEQVQGGQTEECCWDAYIRKQEGGWMMQLPEQMINDFLQAMEERNSKNALKTIGEMRRCMAGNGLCEENKKYLRYYIFQMMISALNKADEDEEKSCIVALTKINTAQEEQFFEQIQYLISTCFNVRGSGIKFEQAIDYIEKNYTRYDFSLEELADVMRVSKTQMSKLFKMKAGCNYIDYLTKLRMEKAKDLLEQTDMSVKDIMNSVGYIDKTNFSKKFKTFYGVNASVWREQKRNQKNKMENL